MSNYNNYQLYLLNLILIVIMFMDGKQIKLLLALFIIYLRNGIFLFVLFGLLNFAF